MTASGVTCDAESLVAGFLVSYFPNADARVVTDLRTATMPVAPADVPIIECYKVTGTEHAPGINQHTIDTDVYAVKRLFSKALALRVDYAFLRDMAGYTVPGKGTIARVSLLASSAERPYVNDNLYRFGSSFLVTVHDRPS